jgi:hypothetical protein
MKNKSKFKYNNWLVGYSDGKVWTDQNRYIHSEDTSRNSLEHWVLN